LSVQNLFRYLILAVLLWLACCPLQLKAQILDDSTRLVYGPHTVEFIREAELINNTDNIYYPDTAVRYFHRFTELEKRRYHYQDLGNMGTALGPIFYQAPATIGERSGYYVYDHWFTSPEEMKYFNTRSPYTKLDLVMAGNGRSRLDVTHTRNVNPRWNVGIDFRRMTSDKQFDPGRARSQENRHAVSTAYDFFTFYRSKDDRYQLLANFSRMNHVVHESGGISYGRELPENISEIIEYDESDSRLQGARSEQLTLQYHAYQQYKLSGLAEVYHRLDRKTQQNQYLHTGLTGFLPNTGQTPPQPGYYQQALISTDSTTDRLNQLIWQNELGLKGDINHLYYRFYYKRRDLQFNTKYFEPVWESEDYAGFALRLAADTSLMLGAEGEYLLGGYYRAGARIKLKWLEASLHRMRYKPAFIQRQYFGNHEEWYHHFEAPTASVLNASVHLPLKRLEFRAGLKASLVERHIYFTADSINSTTRPLNVRPEQAGAAAQILSPYAFVRWEVAPRLFWETEITYSMVTGRSARVFNIPDLIYNGSFYYEGEMFGGNMLGQLGIDAHWKSAYFANAYDPVTQQFLVQDDFQVPAYPLIDVFFAFKISRTRVFLRMSHANQGIPEDGYFVTPFYPGVRRTFDLGIDWLFFD
jgi:hypothetical protein